MQQQQQQQQQQKLRFNPELGEKNKIQMLCETKLCSCKYLRAITRVPNCRHLSFFQIFKASSPKFMEVILLGAICTYCTLIVSYFQPTNTLCIARPWLRHIGFVLVYGPLALKTWRVALIFRVRSAQKLALSDGVLLKRLCLLVLLYSSYLTVWTVMQPPIIETAVTADDLKYERCVENWFDLTIIFGDIVVLIWGMWLCYKIRNAPAAYNESKFISWAIYNAMFVTSFLMVVRLEFPCPSTTFESKMAAFRLPQRFCFCGCVDLL
ncbi:probable G-protein coupled receptor CG31760 [Orbicella faveolata]|nr:probable G-protein coupled receptor CG31760 [Orbicella faveolata]